MIQSWYRVERDVAAATYDLARKSYSANGEVSEKGVCSAWSLHAPAAGSLRKKFLPRKSSISIFCMR